MIVAAVVVFHAEIASLFKNRDEIRRWIHDRGTLGPLLFIGLQIAQVVVFLIPGEVTQLTGGFVFGFWMGCLFSVLGIGLGSFINYLIGKTFGRSFLRAILGEQRLLRAEAFFLDRKTTAGYLFLFLLPGLPKDALCYVAGMAKAPPVEFLAASLIARLPGIAGSSLIGTAAYAGQFSLALWLLAAASLVAIAGLIWRKPLADWLGSRFRDKGERT